MIKAALILLTVLTFEQKQPLPRHVYLCGSSQSYAYHYYKSCNALESCTGKVKTLTRAWVLRDKKKKLCSICKNMKTS